MANPFTPAHIDIDIENRENGDIILRNNVPLADCPRNLGTWLNANAHRCPQKLFLMQRSPEGAWAGLTHAETLARVNRLSNGLVASGLELTRPVAVLSENSVDMAVVQLAAMQIGLPVAPISFAYSVRSQTGGHIKHILDVTDAGVIFLSDADLHMPKLNQWDLGNRQLYAFRNSEHYENVSPWEDLLSDTSTLTPETQTRFDAVGPDTLAKIQFTSGSTKLPKGVEVTHGMQISNQVAIHQMWPFLDGEEVVVDWLPWNHTFGGNFVFNMMLMHGGTFYIDHGNPTPQGIGQTIANVKSVRPTLYFGVPRSYVALYSGMAADNVLKSALFQNLKFIFTAAAALDQPTFEGMRRLSTEVQGRPVPFFSAWGCTETAPDATLIYWDIDDARVIGLPIPGVAIKMAADPSGKRELRVKGPNVTAGYYRNPAATAAAFDDEGYYLTQDGGKFLDPDTPPKGLIFDGRTSEDFKLSSGAWVFNSGVRGSINNLGQPHLLEVVTAAPNRDYLSALVFPNLPLLRQKFESCSNDHPDDGPFLRSEPVTALFRDIFGRHNATAKGTTARIERFILLEVPPRIDCNETTDKGYINQSAVLTHRAEQVDQLYTESPPEGVVLVDP